MQKNEKWYTKIWAISLFMYMFFPVGFYFLYERIKANHGKYYARTKILYWFGLVWGGIGLFYAIGIILVLLLETEPIDGAFIVVIIFALIFIIPGALLYNGGRKMNAKLKIYNKYIKYISVRQRVKIENLCRVVNEGYDVVVATLEDMITLELISGYIDDNEFIIGKRNSYQAVNDYSEPLKETKVIKCKECGAKNTVVVGKKAECEYCGTILQ